VYNKKIMEFEFEKILYKIMSNYENLSFIFHCTKEEGEKENNKKSEEILMYLIDFFCNNENETIEEKYDEFRKKLGNDNEANAHMLKCLFIDDTEKLVELNNKLVFVAKMILIRAKMIKENKNSDEIIYLSQKYDDIIKKKDNFFKNLNRFIKLFIVKEISNNLINDLIKEATTNALTTKASLDGKRRSSKRKSKRKSKKRRSSKRKYH
jgi:hypothetical protein